MEYRAPDANAKVRAANVVATLSAFRLLPELGRRIIESHNLQLENLRPDNFIPVQRWLDALREVESIVGPNKLREVGRNIILAAAFPPELSDVFAILAALDRIYYLNHTGDVGHYVCTRLSPDMMEVRCMTPYPAMFERGLIEGICAHTRANGRYSVHFTQGAPGDDLTCTIVVERMPK